MSDLSDLRNIGPRSASWLQSVGIRSPEDLAEVGVIEAYLRAKEAYPDQVSLNLLYGLQAAMMDIDWKQIPENVKSDLREQAGD
jgi:DNA transformation protein